MVVIGIAMLQGARHAHMDAILTAATELSMDIEIVELRTKDDLENHTIDALMLPGGESTVMRLRGNDDASLLLPALFNCARMRQDPSWRRVLEPFFSLIHKTEGHPSSTPISIAMLSVGKRIPLNQHWTVDSQAFSFAPLDLEKCVTPSNARYPVKW